MNAIKVFGFAVAATVSTSVLAGWNLTVGYAWRAQADTDFKGGERLSSGGGYADGTVSPGTADWTGGSIVDDVVLDVFTPGQYLYALKLNRAESVGGGSDEDAMSGVNVAADYDFWDVGPVSFGVNVRFAGYWGLKNSSAGGYSNYVDYFPFESGPFPGYGAPASGVDVAGAADPQYREYLAGGPGGRVTLKSDLYQIGFGPKVTWHVLSCLDVYGGVEALCTFANSELDAGGASTDEVNCLWGVGGHVGFTGWMTENVGLFGQVGYEWIDEDDVSARGVRAETDYSSLVLSAGLQVRF